MPTVKNLKVLIRMNAIKDCPVTVEDVNIAEKIFGPDIGTLKGKSVQRPPKPVKEDLVDVPPKINGSAQELDTMHRCHVHKFTTPF